MNRRQWLTLAVGVAAAVSVVALSTSRPSATPPPTRTASGEYSQDFVDAKLPKWSLLTALGLVTLSGVLIYRGRSHRP